MLLGSRARIGPDLSEQEFGALCEEFASSCGAGGTLPADSVGEVLSAAGLVDCVPGVSALVPPEGGWSYDLFMVAVREERVRRWVVRQGGVEALADVQHAWAELGGGEGPGSSIPAGQLRSRAVSLGLPAAALCPGGGAGERVSFADFTVLAAQRQRHDPDEGFPGAEPAGGQRAGERHAAGQLPFEVMLQNVRPETVRGQSAQREASSPDSRMPLSEMLAQLRRDHQPARRQSTMRHGRWPLMRPGDGGSQSQLRRADSQHRASVPSGRPRAGSSKGQEVRQRGDDSRPTDRCALLHSAQLALRAELEGFLAGEQCQLGFPATLTWAERNFVNDWCDEHPELSHVTVGEWPLRTVIVTKSRIPPARQTSLSRELQHWLNSGLPQHQCGAGLSPAELRYITQWISEHAPHVRVLSVGDWPERTLTLSKRGMPLAVSDCPQSAKGRGAADDLAPARGLCSTCKVPAPVPIPQWMIVRDQRQRIVLRRQGRGREPALQRERPRPRPVPSVYQQPIGVPGGTYRGAVKLMRQPAGMGECAVPLPVQQAALAALWANCERRSEHAQGPPAETSAGPLLPALSPSGRAVGPASRPHSGIERLAHSPLNRSRRQPPASPPRGRVHLPPI
eukprot:TRINITY_DN61445_c0_g1_i1.p1 TRINITY_DN61445_c0_g1~~TRINITY_DN61445_c0_g1_i1.p1  ORF type:complete len:623 (+),score=159.51 TRINITY_DN61445_c0_g1_i1:101-1969(+)